MDGPDATTQPEATTQPGSDSLVSQPGSGNANVAARDDWYRTSAAANPSSSGPESQMQAPGSVAPQIDQQKPVTVPVAVTPMKRGGMLGVMDSVADALVGKTRPELGKDPDGNLYVKQRSLTKGEQWMRIAATAAAGATAGLAAGKGAGNMGKAGVAGIATGQKIGQGRKDEAKEMSDQVKQQQLDNANNQMLRMKMAEEAWRATRNNVEATQHDIEFSQNQEDRLTKEGGVVLGTVAHPGDIGNVLKVNPDLAADMVKNHQIEIVAHTNGDGTRGGFKVIKMPGNGYRDQMLPAGSVFHTFDPITEGYIEHHASDPMTAGERDDYDTAASTAAMKFKADKLEQEHKQAATQEAQANASEVPSKIAKNEAQAEKDRADAAKDAAADPNSPGGQALVDMIGTGKMPVGRMAYLASRNPALLDAVAAKYKDFDGSKIDAYVKAYQDFTSGKTAVALNAGATALGHMKELMALNTSWSHIPGTPAWNAYENKVDTLATELAKFYGDATIPAIQAIKDTLGANLYGGRAAAIKTQAQSMSDKFNSYEQQWKNAAPSAAYEAQMPQLSDEAKEARAALDPAYKKRLIEEKKNHVQNVPVAAGPGITGHFTGNPADMPQIEAPLVSPRPSQQAPAQAFSKSAWQRKNPGGDVNAAVAAAQAQKLPVVD